MNRRRIALFNPIFAHYRAALLSEFEQSSKFEYSLFADTHDPIGGIPALRLDDNPRFVRTRCRQFLWQISWQSEVIRTALSNRHDVLIFPGNPLWLSTWIGAAIARLRRRRVLFWTHGWIRKDSGLKRRLRVAFYRLAHGLLLYGDRARSIALEHGFDAASLYVIYNSLDYEHQQRLLGTIGDQHRRNVRAELFGDPGVPCVIAVARLTARKRFDLLIDAMALVNRESHVANLLVVGDGPERRPLEELASRRKVTAAFVGACYDETRIAELFSCATVCVSPGDVGLTCMHSLGYGVPVITHDDPADQMPEWEAITPGVTGDLFKRGDAADLARVLARWIDTHRDPHAAAQECRRVLTARYHPAVQRRLIEVAAAGELPSPVQIQCTPSGIR